MTQPPPAPPRSLLLRTPALTLWLACGGALLAVAATAPFTRTQEARVLVVGRETADGQAEHWLIPRANGQVRLRKPPLTYWLAGLSFQVLGVSTFAGRLPMAISAWLLVGLTYRMGRRLLGHRAGLLAMGMLTSMYLLLRYGPLAETDTIAALFVSLAIWAIWRGMDSGRQNVSRQRLWYQLSAIAMALAMLAKGPPAGFPLLFLLAMAAIRRTWRPLLDWLRSGAPLTFAVMGGWWWLAAWLHPSAHVITEELERLTAGRGHFGWPWEILGYLTKGTLPWVGFVVLAIAAAFVHQRGDQRLRGLLLWAGVILLALAIVPQKQEHYVITALPPLALLVGWSIDRALDGSDPPLRRAMALVLGGTAMAGVAAAVAVPIAGRLVRGHAASVDAIVAAVLALSMTALLLLLQRRRLESSLGGALLAALLSMSLVLGPWSDSIAGLTDAEAARAIRQRFGAGPYAFHDPQDVDLEICFELRQVVPAFSDDEALLRAAAATPRLVVLDLQRKSLPEEPRPGLVKEMEFQLKHEALRVYRMAGALAPSTGQATP